MLDGVWVIAVHRAQFKVKWNTSLLMLHPANSSGLDETVAKLAISEIGPFIAIAGDPLLPERDSLAPESEMSVGLNYFRRRMAKRVVKPDNPSNTMLDGSGTFVMLRSLTYPLFEVL